MSTILNRIGDILIVNYARLKIFQTFYIIRSFFKSYRADFIESLTSNMTGQLNCTL